MTWLKPGVAGQRRGALDRLGCPRDTENTEVLGSGGA